MLRTTPVSGPSAAAALVDAVIDLDERDEVDVIILARGGGDATELLPFSDEDLCRAVAACATPTVSAIGHDGDRPLLDDVADHRCGTPSIAAALVVPSEADLRDELDYWLDHGTRERCRAASPRPANASTRSRRRAPSTPASSGRRNDSNARNRGSINAHPKSRLDACVAMLAGYTHTLHALDPARVLDRGYAVVRTATGEVVRDAKQLATG